MSEGEITDSLHERVGEIEAFLKMTESIKVELIPANDYYPDNKSYEWHLEQYTEDELRLTFDFEHPEYISSGNIDTAKITINNAEKFL